MELVASFSELKQEARSLLFCGRTRTFNSIDNRVLSALSNFFCTSRIVLEAIQQADRAPWFNVQRELFDLYFYIFNHPEFDARFTNDWTVADGIDTFSITHHIYDIAEWQNDNPAASGNLFAESEWLSRIVYRYGRPAELNPAGLQEAFRLWRDTALLSIRIRPERVVRQFEQLREAALSSSHLRKSIVPHHPVPDWFHQWNDKYSAVDIGFGGIAERNAAVTALRGGSSEPPWNSFSRKAKLYPIEFIECPTEETILNESLDYEGKRSLYFLYAGLAYFERWRELDQVWFNTQPLEAEAHWVGSSEVLSRKAKPFSDFIAIASKWEMHLDGRVPCSPHFARAAVFLFHIMSEGSDSGEISFSSGSIVGCDALSDWLATALKFLPVLEGKSVCQILGINRNQARKHKKHLKQAFSRELPKILAQRDRLLSGCKPNSKQYPEDRKNISEMWQRTNEEFWKQIEVYDLFGLSSTSSVGNMVDLTGIGHESYRYTTRSRRFIHGIDFGGRNIADKLIFSTFDSLALLARFGKSPIAAGSVWLLPGADYDTHHDEAAQYVLNKTGSAPTEQDKFFWLRGETGVVAVVPDSIELKLHKWNSSLDLAPDSASWFPAVYGTLNFAEKLEASLFVFSTLVVKTPNSIVRLI